MVNRSLSLDLDYPTTFCLQRVDISLLNSAASVEYCRHGVTHESDFFLYNQLGDSNETCAQRQ